MLQSATAVVLLLGVAIAFPLHDAKRATDFGSFDPNALYNQMSQQTQQFLGQNGVSSGSGTDSQKSSGGSSSGVSSSGTGGFDANALYQQQSQLMQQYISSHQTGTSGGGSSSTSGSSSSSSGSSSGSSVSGSGSGSSSSAPGSSMSGSGSSSGSGSFDPNAMYQQQSQLNLQKLESTMQNANAKFDANAVNNFQTSDGGSSGFNPNQINAMNSNMNNLNGQTSGSQTGSQTSDGHTTDSQE